MAVAFTVLYFGFNFRFEMTVFAVHSAFFETKMFAFFKTNFADELILILYLTGLALMIFSKERNEGVGIMQKRHDAMRYAFFINLLIQLFVILFIYGQGFIAFLVLNIINLPLLYLVLFFIMKRGVNEQQRK
ncbi:MAG: hypothetical protein Q7J82_08190 [Coriobacteriia bacterium]|nr:hypothetical protein [Coriobacteriia bacterium]